LSSDRKLKAFKQAISSRGLILSAPKCGPIHLRRSRKPIIKTSKRP
jgi:hypothetical protein